LAHVSPSLEYLRSINIIKLQRRKCAMGGMEGIPSVWIKEAITG
jgi:hypothetical protein